MGLRSGSAVVLAACAALAGCPAAPGADGRAEVPRSPDTLTPGGAAAVPPAGTRHFDPGAVAVGDTVLGLRVADIDVERVFDERVWSGRVRFAGEILLTGIFQRHFDHPEPAELCFHVREPASLDRIPAFAPDEWTSTNEKTWFCFTNTDAARRLLGTGDPPLHATVVVDDYRVIREFSDVYDTARLVRVASMAGPATQSLREP
jgi:hypothetical protein